MSVIQIDPKILSQVAACLIKQVNNNVVDEWYVPSIKKIFEKENPDIYVAAIDIVKKIADINAINWCKRYKETCPSLRDFIVYENRKISIIQYYKYLQFILYNICDYEEDFSMEHQKLIADLRILKGEVAEAIIASTEEYEKANWSNI